MIHVTTVLDTERTCQLIQNAVVPYQEQEVYARLMSEMYALLAGATTIGERIRRLLTERKMTLGDLHRRSGVAKGYLSEFVK